MKREEAISRIDQIVRRVTEAAGIELVDIELKGSGRFQKLLIVIDKPGGVTHADCELITREAGDELDSVDPVAGSYELEVSSPGVERPLKKWQDWERFQGHKVKVVLKQPLADSGGISRRADLKHFDGAIVNAQNQSVTVGLADGQQVTFPFEQVSRANLKFEW